MTKIHIIGGPGSGKTYLGRELSKCLSIDVLDLDTIFWDDKSDKYGIKNDKEKRLTLLEKFISKEKYIIEGVYDSWLEKSFDKADIIIILKPSLTMRTFRILKRFFSRKFGFATTKKENIFDLFRLLKWSLEYNKVNLPRIEKLKNVYTHKVFVFDKADKALDFIKKLSF